MANKSWIKGGSSPNPKGRPRNPSRSVQLLVAKFLKTNMQGKRLQLLYDKLKPEQQIELISILMPYAVAKVQPDEQPKTPVLPWGTLNVQIVQPTQVLTNGHNGHSEHIDDNDIPAIGGN